MSPEEAFGIFLILVGCAGPVIIVGVIYYLKKRLEHKQIMTAIEKGTPLSELWPSRQNGTQWIRNVTVGIALLIIGLGWSVIVPTHDAAMFVAIVVIGIGIASLIRGLLNRKYQTPNLTAAKVTKVPKVESD